ncbi:MAG: LysM domain-containing protein [Desulfotomaculaceae bacterium]|nr:LysM domain-containing protein [Desulfotomaculaceae bacterium]
MDYVIQPGDTLTSIAARFGVTVENIVRVNPILVNPNAIFPGQIIHIPLAGQIPVAKAALYIVQPGETLTAIALRYNIPVGALLQFNPQITNPNLIFPGQIIAIPLPYGAVPQMPVTPIQSPNLPPNFPPFDPL